jgi:hypothetical protein
MACAFFKKKIEKTEMKNESFLKQKIHKISTNVQASDSFC